MSFRFIEGNSFVLGATGRSEVVDHVPSRMLGRRRVIVYCYVFDWRVEGLWCLWFILFILVVWVYAECGLVDVKVLILFILRQIFFLVAY